MAGRLYTEDDVRALAAGSELVLEKGDLATPSALDLAFVRGVRIQRRTEPRAPGRPSSPQDSPDLWRRMLEQDGSYVVRVVAGRAEVYRLRNGVPERFPQHGTS